MKEFNIQAGAGELIIHIAADNSAYEVIYDHGQIVFQNSGRKYVIPDTIGDKINFFAADPSTGKRSYIIDNVRSLYRDTTPTDFGFTNVLDAVLDSTHFTEEIVVGGINESIPVVAPSGVVIWVNGSAVVSGTLVEVGDAVKFEIPAGSEFETTSNFNLSLGDITHPVSITTEVGVKESCKAWFDYGRTTSGVYTIDHGKGIPFNVWCDMSYNGGGWVDVYRTFLNVDNSITMRRKWFLDDNLTGNPIADANGFYQAYYDAGGNASCHAIHIHLNPKADYNYNEITMDWILQGSDENYRCSSGNWVPLNGPGYNGGGSGYAAACPTGINCIQGVCQNGRDAPVSGSYTTAAIASNTYFTWSGSACSGFTTTANCSRSATIPTNKVAVWFNNLRLR